MTKPARWQNGRGLYGDPPLDTPNAFALLTHVMLVSIALWTDTQTFADDVHDATLGRSHQRHIVNPA